MLAPLVAASQHALAAALELMRGAYRRLRCRLCYALKIQCPRALDSAARAELELLLRAAHGDRDYSALFRDKGRLYTATFQNRTVACVFTYSVDCDFRGTDRPVWNVRALSVLPAHRRQGLAARLLARVKRDAARNESVWLELHVDEKRDRSHECLLEMYRKLGFLVLPRPQQAEYLLLCMDF